ncbi:MAG: TolC family protein [Bacteroidales bacterium]
MIKKTSRSYLQDLETRKLEKEQHRLSVIGRSTSLYMSILQVNKQVEILGLKMILLQRHYQVSRGMWMAGLRSELDMLQTESEIARLKEDSTQLTMVQSNLTIELAQLLGMDSADGLHLATLRLDAPEVFAVPDISIENLADNPLLSVLDSRLAAEQFRMDEITAYQIPHVTLGTGLVKDADPTGDGNFLQINAGVSIPIYAGNTFTYQKQGSQAMSESLAAQRSDAERELMIHLMKIHDNLVQTRSLMELQHQRLDISSRAVDFAEVNYKSGIASNIDVLASQQQLTNTELEIEQTRLEYVVNLIEFYLTNNQVDRILAMGGTQAVN